MVAAVLFGAGGPGGPALPEWQSLALGLGLVVTLFGLATFELVVRDAGERVLGRLGTIAFLLGCVSWIVADAVAVGGLPWIFELERNYVVLACFAQVALGWAILRTESSPAGPVGQPSGGAWSGLPSTSAGLCSATPSQPDHFPFWPLAPPSLAIQTRTTQD